jgi:hypothetical protein
MSYVSWPVQTLTMDDLLKLFLQREQRDACQLSYMLLFNKATSAVERVVVYSKSNLQSLTAGTGPVTAGCTVPIIVPSTATLTGVNVVDGPPSGVGVSQRVLELKCAGSPGVMNATNLWW